MDSHKTIMEAGKKLDRVEQAEHIIIVVTAVLTICYIEYTHACRDCEM